MIPSQGPGLPPFSPLTRFVHIYCLERLAVIKSSATIAISLSMAHWVMLVLAGHVVS
jgi:hypothetical protein